MGTRRKGLTIVAFLLAAVLTACTDIDTADQKVIDRLAKLDVLSAPPGSTRLAYTEEKGGGNDVIRNASAVIAVYASPQQPLAVGRYYITTFQSEWGFQDRGIDGLGGWDTIGSRTAGPGPVATIRVRPPLSTDLAPRGTRAIVTVQVSDTRPG